MLWSTLSPPTAPARVWRIPLCVPRMPGYLTRRLVDVAQDVIINELDCDTQDGIPIRKSDDVAGQSMGTRLFGRMVGQNVVDPKPVEVLAERGDVLDHDQVRHLANAGV